MAKPKPPLKGEAAKKFYGGMGIEQYFSKVIKDKPKKKAGRPKKRRLNNYKKTKADPPPPTSLKSPSSGEIVSTASQDNADDDDKPVPPLAPQVLEDSDDDKSVSPLPAPAKPKPAKPKATRINGTVGEHRLLMEQAVNDWLKQTDSAYEEVEFYCVSDWAVDCRQQCRKHGENARGVGVCICLCRNKQNQRS